MKIPSQDAKKSMTFKERIIAFFSHEPSWYWTHYKQELGYLSFFIVMAIHF